MTKTSDWIAEKARETGIAQEADVVVCGAGPAGIVAALASARAGARTVLLEVHGCLGGVWTAGLLCWILDAHSKEGIMREITQRLESRGARQLRVPNGKDFAYDIEEMKLLLEEMAEEAGIYFQYHTRVVGTQVEDGKLTAVLTESKSGRQAWRASAFVDATGDGDLGALAGCGFDLGHPETKGCQPMSLIALISGLNFAEIESMVAGSLGTAPKERLRAEMNRAGHSPSYSAPTLFRLRDDLFGLMANHEYGASALDAAAITRATAQARREVHGLVKGLASLKGPWENIRIVATAAQIGVREGRRIHGRAQVTAEDALAGARYEDAVCRVNMGFDVHSTNPANSKGYDDYGKGKSQPFDIRYGCLVARDVEGLLMAGRCISGDFWAHSAYRVTGNAVAMGEAAGLAAAISAHRKIFPCPVNTMELLEELGKVKSKS
jgi:hypothetical protein